MGFPASSLFSPREHLIGGGWVDAMLARKLLNRFSLVF